MKTSEEALALCLDRLSERVREYQRNDEPADWWRGYDAACAVVRTVVRECVQEVLEQAKKETL